MKSRFISVAALLLVVAGCSSGWADGGAAGHGGGSSVDVLEGTWAGLTEVGNNIVMVVDRHGDILDVLLSGAPLGIRGTTFELEPQIFQLVSNDSTDGVPTVLLTDEAFGHALLASATPPGTPMPVAAFGSTPVALTKDPPLLRRPQFAEDDIIGVWLGYGYVYNEATEAFEKRGPVEVVASVGFPSTRFIVSLPEAAALSGTITDFDPDHGRWEGQVETGDVVAMVMTIDKSFVGVVASDPTLSGVQALAYFALTRQ